MKEFFGFIIIVGIVIALIAGGAGKGGSRTANLEAKYPQPTDYVSDENNILKDETEAKLREMLSTFDKKESGQVAVVVIKTTAPLTIEQYSIKLAEYWKVGYKGLDNGVLLVIASDDRKVRLEVGRGVEDKITDGIAGGILDTKILPSFKQGNMDEGVINGVTAVIERLDK